MHLKDESPVPWTVTQIPTTDARAVVELARLNRQAGECAVAIFGKPITPLDLHKWIGWPR